MLNSVVTIYIFRSLFCMFTNDKWTPIRLNGDQMLSENVDNLFLLSTWSFLTCTCCYLQWVFFYSKLIFRTSSVLGIYIFIIYNVYIWWELIFYFSEWYIFVMLRTNGEKLHIIFSIPILICYKNNTNCYFY